MKLELKQLGYLALAAAFMVILVYVLDFNTMVSLPDGYGQMNRTDTCWLEVWDADEGVRFPIYDKPYYWQRYGNMTDVVVKTDCLLLQEACDNHVMDLNCRWLEEERTCSCEPGRKPGNDTLYLV